MPHPSAESFPSSPELHSSAEVAQSLQHAVKAVYEITADPDFETECLRRGVNPYEHFGTIGYLEVLADTGRQTADRDIADGIDPLACAALEFVTATPLAINKQIEADKSGSSYRHAAQASEFNDLLRSFATAHPTTKVVDLQKAMLNVTNMTTEEPNVRTAAPHKIHNLIRGAQHELAVGIIAAQTGRTVFPADSTQDLRHVDWMVTSKINPDRILYLDAKASLKQIVGADQPLSPYVVKPGGRITIYSCCRDEDFKGMVVLPAEVAARKAPDFDEILNAADSSILGSRAITWSA